jgi:hypothetical protein
MKQIYNTATSLLTLIPIAYGLKDPFLQNRNNSWMVGKTFLKNQKYITKYLS